MAILTSMFVNNFAFYPLETNVLLSNGQTGKIIGIHAYLPFRPIVETNSAGEKGPIDLAEKLTLFIDKVLD